MLSPNISCPASNLAVVTHVVLKEAQYSLTADIFASHMQYFYEDALQDAPEVLNTPPEPFYEAPLLKPYVFFDVAGGREARGGAGSKSKTNRVNRCRRI